MQTSTQTVEASDMIVTESRKLRLVKVEMAGDSARFERGCGLWCACPDCLEALEEEAWGRGI